MAANSLQWGHETTHACSVFSTPISSRNITEWVITIDTLLHAVFAQGMEDRGLLHEAIQRGLDAADEDTHMECVCMHAETSAYDALASVKGQACTSEAAGLTGGILNTVQTVKGEDELGCGVEDEMLMDV